MRNKSVKFTHTFWPSQICWWTDGRRLVAVCTLVHALNWYPPDELQFHSVISSDDIRCWNSTICKRQSNALRTWNTLFRPKDVVIYSHSSLWCTDSLWLFLYIIIFPQLCRKKSVPQPTFDNRDFCNLQQTLPAFSQAWAQSWCEWRQTLIVLNSQ